MSSVMDEQPPSPTVSAKMKNSSKLSLKNLPSGITDEEVGSIVENYANVKSFELSSSGDDVQLEVLFDSHPAALKAFEELQNFSYKDHDLQVEFMRSGNRMTTIRTITNHNKPHPLLQRIPLRMLVSTQFVGAIIGKKGACVKDITTKCKARIDVHSKDASSGSEKVISIYGQAERRSEACKQVLEVLCQQGAYPSEREVVLKLLAGDQFSGRLIGKEGRHIMKVREQSNAKINIVGSHELSSFYPDRVVVVRGGVDEVVLAESLISKKLALCYEADAANSQAAFSSNMYLPGKPFKIMPNFFEPYLQKTAALANKPPNAAPVYPMGNYGYGDGFPQPILPQAVVSESVQVGVPDSAVGAIIGPGGAVIKQMMRSSGAYLSIERKDERSSPSEERTICIKGGVESCCRALYSVFERMRMEGFSGPGESRLKVVVSVPLEVVGRLIGRGGANIRSLQKVTGAIVRVVAPATPPTTKGEEPHEDKRQEGDGRKTPLQADVQLYGSFSAILNAHMRIRSMAQQTTFENLNKLNNNNMYNNLNNNNNVQKPPRNKMNN